MKKFIRLPGLGAFAVIVLLIGGSVYLFADSLAAAAIKKSFSKVTGLEMKIAKTDLTFSPLGIKLDGIEISDPDHPSRGHLLIESSAFDLDPGKLLRRKAIINQMTADGVQQIKPSPAELMQARAEQLQPTQAEPVKEKRALPKMKKLDIEEIMRNEQLETLNIVSNTETEITARQAFWQQRLKELPDQPKLTEYQTRLQTIKQTDTRDLQAVLKATNDLKQIKNELESDIRLIQTTRTELSQEKGRLQKMIDKAKAAPANDIRRLQRKYSPSSQGVANISRLLFGDKIATWVKRGLDGYTAAAPYIKRMRQPDKPVEAKPERAKGQFVRFKEHEPLPDFLIRNLQLSVIMTNGTLGGSIQNITARQEILGQPLTFSLTGEDRQGISLQLDGSVDRTKPETARDAFSLKVDNYPLNDIEISAGSLPLTLERAAVASTISGNRINEQIRADAATVASQAQFSSELPEGDIIYGPIAEALLDIHSFSLNTTINGTFDDYKIDLSSDLDEILKRVGRRAMQAYSERFKQELSAAVEAKVKQPLEDLDQQLAEMAKVDQELAERLELIRALLGDDAFSNLLGGFKLPF